MIIRPHTSNTSIRRHISVMLLVVLAGTVPGVMAQPSTTPANKPKTEPAVPTPATTQPTAPPSEPAPTPVGKPGGIIPNANIAAPAEAKLEIWPEARPILDKEHVAFRAMRSMAGVITSKWETLTEGQQPITTDHVMEFALQKPDKLMLKTRDLTVYVDGKTLTVHSPALKQYIQRPMPPLWNLRETIEQLSLGQIRTLPSEPLLRPGMSVEQALRNVKSIERVREADYEGRPGFWVAGTATDERQPSTIPYTFERWYSAADGLSYAVRQDWTAMYQEMATRHHAEQSQGDVSAKPAARVQYAKWTTVIKRTPNAEVSPSVFMFAPAADDKLVDELLFPRPNLKEQVAMIGKPAPAMEGVDLDNAPVKLADFAGKVVLIDFWATWCGPCIQGMPHMEGLKTRYADKPFVVLGVNRDAPGASAKVKRFLTKRGFTIPQFDDSSGSAANIFGVVGIPCTILIDAQGVVQDVDVGYLPGKEQQISAKVEKVLSGQALRTPEELQRLREQVGLPGK